ESELFGHEKGSFTGAFERKKGKFELADEGTLFLEEVGDLPLNVQSKLQNVIDGEGIERINQNKVQFDPNFHEAISNEENPEFASGEVIEVVRQGYKLGDRILRPAMVRVAR
ncbi:MAG: nucleotide exchange factor GrpE, partial [Desulfobulbaceae bacterium]|nr:nucleotide exchange factor GrpE [Desulfobulbaceae bacterium]